MRRCPALLIGAPASGQGKTWVTAALAHHCRMQGHQVRVFKCGPDFLDPMLLAQASGHPVYSLDLWLVGEKDCRRLLWQAAAEADLILIEGVMGLFDGTPSAADLACRLNIPVLGVIDARAMAQTFGAVAHGLAHYRPNLPFAGVFANRVSGTRHATLLQNSVPTALHWYGALPRDPMFELPQRHLGLVQAQELDDLTPRLERAAEALLLNENPLDIAPPVCFAPPVDGVFPQKLSGVRIGVARDEAFSFVYAANLDLLTRLGAELRVFSPLHDQNLPDVDSLYLPGGYPELYLTKLAHHANMHQAITEHHLAGKPIVAECGGMLYLLDRLTDTQGHSEALIGLISGQARMASKLVALALQEVALPEGCLRGHTYHHSQLESPLKPIALGQCPNGKSVQEGVFRIKRLTASYIHFYFPSNPQATAALFLP